MPGLAGGCHVTPCGSSLPPHGDIDEPRHEGLLSHEIQSRLRLRTAGGPIRNQSPDFRLWSSVTAVGHCGGK